MPGLLNWLRVELHKLHDLDRHPDFHRKAEPSIEGGQNQSLRIGQSVGFIMGEDHRGRHLAKSVKLVNRS